MPRPVDSVRRGAQVNVLKKVRTSQGWRLCPVVREANGRLRDRARVGGRIEVHTEGVYYLEWREDGRRLRAAIPNAAEVLERARLKSLELEARQTGVALDALRPEGRAESLAPVPRTEHYAKVTIEPPSNRCWTSFRSYCGACETGACGWKLPARSRCLRSASTRCASTSAWVFCASCAACDFRPRCS